MKIHQDKEDTTTVSGVFKDENQATNVIAALEARGVPDEDISVVMSDSTHRDYFNFKTQSKMPEGAAVGASSGGAIGGILAGLTTVGTLAIPGLNIVAVGPIVALAAGVGAGGTLGGVTGALIGLGFKEREAKLFQEQIKSGGILIAARVSKDLKSEAKKVFENNQVEDLMVA